MNATRQLRALGKGLWLDNITRRILVDGTLERLVTKRATLVSRRDQGAPPRARP